MTPAERAQARAMACLNGWADAMKPTLNALEMLELKRRMTAAFREYEERADKLQSLLDDGAKLVDQGSSIIKNQEKLIKHMDEHCKLLADISIKSCEFMTTASKVCEEKFLVATYFAGDSRIVHRWADLRRAVEKFNKWGQTLIAAKTEGVPYVVGDLVASALKPPGAYL